MRFFKQDAFTRWCSNVLKVWWDM